MPQGFQFLPRLSHFFFFFNKCSSNCYKDLVNFQSSEKAGFDHFACVIIAFIEKQILGFTFSASPVDVLCMASR